MALASAEVTSMTRRSGPPRRKTVKIGARLPVTTTRAPDGVPSRRTSRSTLASADRAGLAARSASQPMRSPLLLFTGLSTRASIGFPGREVGLQLGRPLRLDGQGDGVGGGLPVGGGEVLGDDHRIAHDLGDFPALPSHPGVAADDVAAPRGVL